MAKYVVATVNEIPPGERKIVEVEGRSVGVFNIDGEFFALRNSCPHQGGSLCEGRLTGLLESSVPGEYTYTRKGEILRCPWHDWEYDLKTGQSWWNPARRRARKYKVSVESGTPPGDDSEATTAGLNKGPYIAETYPASVEQQYVVVEIA
jgi:3-phenylpropionate/trans-cinnamate dioxygenase ferredoxin subunit